MNTCKRLVLAATLCFGIAGIFTSAAEAAVTINFVKPENYGDMPFSPQAKERVLDDLRSHLTKLASKLAPGQDLKLDILDVDLAGRMAFSRRGAEDYRILSGGADWPVIRLRFALESNGVVILSGEERLSDMDYMNHGKYYASETSLRYEKHMLDDWFKRKFLTPAN